MKIHLGCNDRHLDGWTNIDLISGPGVDIVASAHDLKSLEDESVDEILAEHLLEHFTFFEANQAFREWYRVLKPGGILTIEVPDLLGLCKAFVEANEYKRYWTSGDYWALICQLFGHQMGRSQEERLAQVHKNGFTEEHLFFILDGVGFVDIKRLEHKKGPKTVPVLRVICQKK